MTAKIHDEMFDVAPVTIENIRSVTYTRTSGFLNLYYTSQDEKEHCYVVNMDSTQYKRRVEFI